MDFAFLIHSRDWTDVQRKFKIARYLPKSWVEFWCLRWPPVVVSKITGLKSQIDGREIKGWLIGVPMTAKQMMENRGLAKRRIIKAIKKAEKLGVGIVGLGALTSSVTNGGLEIADKVKAKITTGHAYTVFTITSLIRRIVQNFSFDIKDVNIAIVGAAGSVGSVCAKVLATQGFRKFTLVDLDRKGEYLLTLQKEIAANNIGVELFVSHRINDIRNSEIVVAATNAPEALIKPEDLKQGAVVVDDAQPSDISPEIIKERRDVLVVNAGVIYTPGITAHINFGLSNKYDNFCCLGEVMILAANDWEHKINLGRIKDTVVGEFGEAGARLGFSLGEIQNDGKAYSKEELSIIKKIALAR